MKILTVIPILNPDNDFFNEIIPSVVSQSVHHEVVIINSGKTIPLSENYTIISVDKKAFNHANTRNLVLAYEANFYLFMTQDAKPYNADVIKNLLSAFNDDAVVVSYARQIPHEDAPISEKFARYTNYPKHSCVKSKNDIKKFGIKTYFSSDSCAMYRGSYFKQMGGFKKDLNVSEDMEFAARAIWDNKKVAYEAQAKVWHSHDYTVFSLFNRYKAIGHFFKENSWIEDSLKDKVSTEKTGIKQVFDELNYVIKKKPMAVFKSVVFNIIKFMAYKLGKY